MLSKSFLSKPVIGWDIGGAHLKAALLSANGKLEQLMQLPCPLWKGVDYLERAISDALQANSIAASGACHAITMTGELVDCFNNRAEGVHAIAEVCKKLLSDDILFYAANEGFVPHSAVKTNVRHIASVNWHASASALAVHRQAALFIDMGSTTTDIIPINHGKVALRSISDAERLQNDSLVYTGVVRTPVMALAQKLLFEGGEVNVMAEYFATMADVYRLTGELASDDADTADGKGKTVLESARRLARMVGHDINGDLKPWILLANSCRGLQMQQLKSAILKHLQVNVPIIGVGAGAFLVQAIAKQLNHPYLHLSEVLARLIEHKPNMATQLEVCFPAYAVAYLALQSLQTQ